MRMRRAKYNVSIYHGKTVLGYIVLASPNPNVHFSYFRPDFRKDINLFS
jgi:hypothetical protein